MTATIETIRIWQQNLNKSNSAQQDLLSGVHATDIDIIALQEPYIDGHHLTRGTPHWRVQYPTVRDPDTAGCARSVMLVSKNISTNAWSPVAIPHPDVTAISIKTTHATVHVFNLYVDGDSDTALHAAA